MQIRKRVRDVLVRALRLPRINAWEDGWWWSDYTKAGTNAGINVDERSALTFGPVYAAVRRISESIASLPLNLYRINGKNKEKATDLPLYRTLHLQPNPEETSMQFREALISHLLLWGNCYSFIERNLIGDILNLWPLDPSRTTPKRENGLLVYEYRMTDTGEKIIYPFWDILHIAGLGFNGLVGYSVISLMREAIGLGLAEQQFSSNFYSHGAHPGGVLESDQTMGDETMENLKKQFMAVYGGVSNTDQLLVLQQGLKFHALTINPRDAEFLESRKFSVREIARWFLIPPHLIGDLERATWANIESQGIDFVVYTLRPILVRFEQGMEVRFRLGPNFEIRHVVEGLLRGDSAARSQFYHNAILDGWMNRNEVRELEDKNPVAGLDEYLTPSNEAPASALKDGNGNAKDKKLEKEAFRMMFQHLSPQEQKSLTEALEKPNSGMEKGLLMLLASNPQLRSSLLEALR